jgi:hypothetical protein
MIISTYMQVMLRIWFKLGSFRVAKKKKKTPIILKLYCQICSSGVYFFLSGHKFT